MRPIGVFDSGYGGLTVFKEIIKKFPEYDYVYLGDNKRVPYGNRDLQTVYEYTKECIEYLFDHYDCPLIILACNTASAKALRQFQQNDLAKYGPNKRVLGIIRPTAEAVGSHLKNPYVGIMATQGTVDSGSYLEEIKMFFPDIQVFQQACPNWVPFIENGDFESEELQSFVNLRACQLLDKCPEIGTIILACTHYPLIKDLIKRHLPDHVQLLGQGELVAESLKDYLQRHPEIESQCTRNMKHIFLTTGNAQTFQKKSSLFLGKEIKASKVVLG